MNKPNNNFCVILAGGKGRRLWPCSREQFPKQFIDFFGTGRTQLQSTFDRFSKLMPKENILVCTNRDYASIVREQLTELDEQNLLIEPVLRNTAPSLAWAHMRIFKRNPDACIVVTPADQLVLDEEAFANNMTQGMEFVSNNPLILALGVKPTRPEPGYGYIQSGEPCGENHIYQVQSFTEKPEREYAQIFMDSGEFFWNTGIFMASVKKFRERLDLVFGDVLRRLLRENPDYTVEEELQFIDENYPAYPNLSIDYAVLDHKKDVCLMQCDFGWADLGTWHSIYECGKKYGEDNVVVDSEVEMENCHNNIIKLPKGKLGVLSGLQGYIVAEEGNVLLICPKGDSSSLVKKFANQVQIKWGEDYI